MTRALLVNGGNDSASWPFPHLSSAPPSAVAMDRHPRVDLRDFAESQSTRATETATQKRDARSERLRLVRLCVNRSHPPPTRHPRELVASSLPEGWSPIRHFLRVN